MAAKTRNQPVKVRSRTRPAPPPVPEEEVLTVNGKPIPDDFAHLIPYEATDQGIAERNARPNRRDGKRVEVTAGPWEKGLAKMEDQAFGDSDRFKEAVSRLEADPSQAGFTFRMLSDRICSRRGMRGWEPVIENGEPVKVGAMFVGRMPKRLARERNAKYQAEGNDALREVAANYEQEQERVIRDGKAVGLEVLRPGEILEDQRDPDRQALTGLHAVRGSEGQPAA